MALGLDEFATYGALYERKENAKAPDVTVEESSCLGSCKMAPCVAVEHEDFSGTVSLEGMTSAEFQGKVFHNIFTEDDVDRVWGCVENAIQVLAQEEFNDEL